MKPSQKSTNTFLRGSLRLMIMASLCLFQTLAHTRTADAQTALTCPGAQTDLSLSTGNWVILGDCNMGNLNLSGSASLTLRPANGQTTQSQVTIAGNVSLQNSSVLNFNNVAITFPQTFAFEFSLNASDQSRVLVSQSTILAMDAATASTRSMFWTFHNQSGLKVTQSSRVTSSWPILQLLDSSFASYQNSTQFFMEIYFFNESTVFVGSNSSVAKLWLPLTLAGTYTLVPNQDLTIVEPATITVTNMTYDIGVILQADNGTNPPAITIMGNSEVTLSLGLIGNLGGPVRLDHLPINQIQSDQYLPAPFNNVLLKAGAYIQFIQIYAVSVVYPVTISNSIIAEVGVLDHGNTIDNPNPCNPCSELIVDHSTLGWADSAATSTGGPNRKVLLTIHDTNIWSHSIFASGYGTVNVIGTSAILGGAFVESSGVQNCAGQCSWVNITAAVTMTPNPACPTPDTTPAGVPLCQPLTPTGSLPAYGVCNGGVINNYADPQAVITNCN
jgi:hypothetical protein